LKPNKDYYELRLSADELRMIDESLARGPIDKDSEDDYNRLRCLLAKHVEVSDVVDGTIPEPPVEAQLL
jgi:hypothetical protein|tara:strand:+ start:1682 stop:1888 length:207 start_codon:yes stop_codon:yes gene_type:complete